MNDQDADGILAIVWLLICIFGGGYLMHMFYNWIGW